MTAHIWSLQLNCNLLLIQPHNTSSDKLRAKHNPAACCRLPFDTANEEQSQRQTDPRACP